MALIPRRPLSLAWLALCGSTALGAAEFEPLSETRDWYLSLGVAVVPEVEEESSGPGGTSTYQWDDLEDDVAPRLAVGYLACAGGPGGGWALGAEVVAATCDITPAKYQVGGLDFANTSGNHLRYASLGVTVFGGYEFGINSDAESISTFLLVTPFVGGGMAYAESDLKIGNDSYAEDSGIGWYVEGGLRLGFIITERHWLLGALVDVTAGTGEVEVDLDSGTSSTLYLDRVGVGGSLVVGYRL